MCVCTVRHTLGRRENRENKRLIRKEKEVGNEMSAGGCAFDRHLCLFDPTAVVGEVNGPEIVI